jgi:hypothetical protein
MALIPNKYEKYQQSIEMKNTHYSSLTIKNIKHFYCNKFADICSVNGKEIASGMLARMPSYYLN